MAARGSRSGTIPGVSDQGAIRLDRVLVVIPAWNERDAIASVLEEIRATLPDVSVVVVDDGSVDGTSDIVQSMGIPALRLPFNVGVGGAMRAGFLYAQRAGFDYVVQVDADGQHNPADVPRLLELARAGNDVVVGARFSGVGDYVVRGPRKWAMKVLSWSVSSISGTRLRDVTSGFRLSGPRAIELFARAYPPEYLGDTVESLILAHRAGLTIDQAPVAMRSRVAGTPSQNPLKSALYLARAGLVLALAVLREPPAKDRL